MSAALDILVVPAAEDKGRNADGSSPTRLMDTPAIDEFDPS